MWIDIKYRHFLGSYEFSDSSAMDIPILFSNLCFGYKRWVDCYATTVVLAAYLAFTNIQLLRNQIVGKMLQIK